MSRPTWDNKIEIIIRKTTEQCQKSKNATYSSVKILPTKEKQQNKRKLHRKTPNLTIAFIFPNSHQTDIIGQLKHTLLIRTSQIIFMRTPYQVNELNQ